MFARGRLAYLHTPRTLPNNIFTHILIDNKWLYDFCTPNNPFFPIMGGVISEKGCIIHLL